jgi:hypothetical protein
MAEGEDVQEDRGEDTGNQEHPELRDRVVDIRHVVASGRRRALGDRLRRN